MAAPDAAIVNEQLTWTAHKAEPNIVYYYNALTRKSANDKSHIEYLLSTIIVVCEIILIAISFSNSL